MNKKKTAAVGVPIAVLLAVIGGSTLNLDFSTTITEIGQIGDINNYIQENYGIDLEKFKENCDAGKYAGLEAETYCELFP